MQPDSYSDPVENPRQTNLYRGQSLRPPTPLLESAVINVSMQLYLGMSLLLPLSSGAFNCANCAPTTKRERDSTNWP